MSFRKAARFKSSLTLLATLWIAGAALSAQSTPAAAGADDSAGEDKQAVGGMLHYDLRFAQTSDFGGYQGGQQESYLSGDASFRDFSRHLPFSLQYSGGYGWLLSGPGQGGNLFQHLQLSQSVVNSAWNLTASENVDYTFETPTTGFSGVPGTGEPIGGSAPTNSTDQTILAMNTRTLDNQTAASASVRLDYATTLNFGGSVGELLYIDSNGQNTDSLASEVRVSRRLDARNSLSGGYGFSRFIYGQGPVSQPNTAQISYSQASSLQISFKRQWTRKISSTGAIGPQWISSSNSAIQPSSTQFTASATVQETFRNGGAGLAYNHGVSGGAGYLMGAENDTISGNYSRGIGRSLNVGVNGSYLRTASLSGNGVVHGEYGGVQATRGLGRYFSVFANYTVMNQSSSLSTSNLSGASNVLNTMSQVIGFGIGYTPRELRIKW
ncbi:MAG: hypothetical protein WB424_11890 [Terracidiphilus sp.]